MDEFLLDQARTAQNAEMRSTVVIHYRGVTAQDPTTGVWAEGTPPDSVTTVGGLTPYVGRMQSEKTQNGLQEARQSYYLSVPKGTVFTSNCTVLVDGVAYQISDAAIPSDPEALILIVSVYR